MPIFDKTFVLSVMNLQLFIYKIFLNNESRLPPMEVFTKFSLINGERILLCFAVREGSALKKFAIEIEFTQKYAPQFVFEF